MKYPEFLAVGDTIAVAAPAGGCTGEPWKSMMEEAVYNLQVAGFNVVIGDCVYKDDGKGISTDPETAAKELETFYLREDVKAIISAGGGETMCETLSHLNLKAISKAKPTWFVGLSDNTNFIFPLATICGVASVYDFNIGHFASPWGDAERECLALLEGESLKVHDFEMTHDPEADVPEGEKYALFKDKKLQYWDPKTKELTEGVPEVMLEGRLLGGCLDCLVNMCGTRFDHTASFVKKQKKVLWALEACDLNPIGIRRALWELKEAGWFRNVSGVLMGRPLSAMNQSLMGIDEYNAAIDMLGEFNVPIVFDCDFGHTPVGMPLLIGSWCQAKVEGHRMTLSYQTRR